MIRPLIEKHEIDKAFAVFAQRVTQGGEKVNCVIGCQGGSEPAQVTWHSEKKLWVFLAPERLENRFWCAFGTDDPTADSTVPVACEMDAPRAEVNRRCTGLFIADSTGTIYLAHSGKIGGGRTGIGKTAFMDSRNSNDVVPVQFPDKKEIDYLVIGGIHDSDFLSELAQFVHSVAEFKLQTVQG